MAPHKAVAWPPSVYEDSAILSLDEAGRFIVCRVCAESFALHGGKTPKPIVMNACFRTRAWETHKRRTRAHRRNQDNSSSRRSPRRSMSDPEGYLAQQMPRQASSPNDREGAQMIPRQARQSSTDRDWSSDPPLLPPMRIRYTREQHTRSVGDLAISLQVPVPQPLRTNTESAHQLRIILNPVQEAEDELTAEGASHEQNEGPAGDWAGASRPERGETHDMYWKTMRALFTRPRNSTLMG